MLSRNDVNFIKLDQRFKQFVINNMGCARTTRRRNSEDYYNNAFDVKKIKGIDCYILTADSPSHSIKHAIESSKNLNSIVKQRKPSAPSTFSNAQLPQTSL